MISVDVSGLDSMAKWLDSFPDATKRAARMAINQTADRKGFTAMRVRMEDQLAFPKGYLTDPTRFRVSERATDDNLEAKVTARQRPTSLARFVTNRSAVGPRPAGQGLTINVKKSRRKVLDRAFLIRLRAGSSGDNTNLGLAVRLSPGEALINKKFARPMQGNLYLLYGPSVEQLFENLLPSKMQEIGDYLEAEFNRQLTTQLARP